MGISLDGLASGLDTTALISSLMQLEAIPQSLLQKKATKTQSVVTILQALNSKIAGLAELAKTASVPAALNIFTATSSSDNARATVTTGASDSTLDFVVGRLATAQTSVSDAVTAWPAGDLTITGAGGPITVTADSLDSLVTAINGAGAGVKALKVAAGKDALGENLYRLQLTSAGTGADGAFSVTGLNTTTTATAQDAEITLWSGTAAAQTITSATNTFAELLPGVSLTVSTASTDPVTLTVARDAAAATGVAEKFTASLQDVFSFIDVRSRVTSSTDSQGKVTTTGGVFQGDSAVRSARQALISAISSPVNGRSPSEIGISVSKSGVLEFDAEKFAAALANDPATVESAMTELAGRVASAADLQSDKYDGMLTSKIKGQESLARNLNTQIDNWDLRLEKRQSTLERTYSALEVRMSALNSQSTWLTSQIASLPTYGGNKS